VAEAVVAFEAGVFATCVPAVFKQSVYLYFRKIDKFDFEIIPYQRRRTRTIQFLHVVSCKSIFNKQRTV